MVCCDNVDLFGFGNMLGWVWVWLFNCCILYNCVFVDLQGNLWDLKCQLLKWDGIKWIGWDILDYSVVFLGSGVGLFIMQQEGMGCLFVFDKMVEGLFLEYYELFEMLLGINLLYLNVILNLVVCIFKDDVEVLGKVDKFLYVGIIYCLIEYFYYWIKYVLLNVILQLEQFVEIGELLVNKFGIVQGDIVKVFFNCGYIKVKVVVIKCICMLKVNGKDIDIIGILIYWGYEGVVKKGFIVNILMLFVGDVNMQMLEFKFFFVNVEKV